MSKRILVATDFNDLGRAAVTTALELAEALDAQVDVLHVFTMAAMPDAAGYTGLQMQQQEANARADLSRAADSVSQAGRLGELLLELGEVVPRLLAKATERGTDLIVIGSHGRKGLSRLLLGSTAEQVMRRAHVPVLVVKQPRPLRRIGVAVDLDVESPHVIATAFELAGALGAKVDLLHVYPPVVVPNEYGAGTIPHETLRNGAREALRDLASPYERLPTMGESLVELGDPERVILELAAKQQLDLLVLGTKGRAGLSRIVVGSVAESVLRSAPMPVLIAKHRTAPPAV